MPIDTTSNREKKSAALKVRVSEEFKKWVQSLAVQDDLDESDIVRRALKFYRINGAPRAF